MIYIRVNRCVARFAGLNILNGIKQEILVWMEVLSNIAKKFLGCNFDLNLSIQWSGYGGLSSTFFFKVQNGHRFSALCYLVSTVFRLFLFTLKLIILFVAEYNDEMFSQRKSSSLWNHCRWIELCPLQDVSTYVEDAKQDNHSRVWKIFDTKQCIFMNKKSPKYSSIWV